MPGRRALMDWVRASARRWVTDAIPMVVATVVLCAAILCLAPTRPLSAQEPGRQEPLRLTLAEALDYAAGSNPELRQATNSTSMNAVESRRVWFDEILPSASLTLFNTSFTGNLQRRALDNFGNPIENPTADWNYFSRTTHSVALNWTVQGPSLFHRYRNQRLTNRDRELSRLVALDDVQIEVQRLYMDALEQRDLLQAEEALIEARQVNLDVAERLFGLALRTRVDILQAELEVERQRLTHQQQESAHRQALLALRSAMGLTDERSIELVDEELPLFDPSHLEAEALIARAKEVNPALLQSDVAIRTGEVGVAQERAAWWPQVDLGVNLYRREQDPGGEGALFEPPGTSELESQFYVQFSIPIFNNYFQHRVDRQQATVDLQNSREADRQVRLETEQQIRSALLELENQWSSVQLTERALEIAQEALRLAREEYRLGSLSFTDLRQSFNDEAQARREAIIARHAFVDALLTLEEAVGAPVREMIPAGAEGLGAGSAGDPAAGAPKVEGADRSGPVAQG